MKDSQLSEKAKLTPGPGDMKYEKPQVFPSEIATTAIQSHIGKVPPSFVDLWGLESTSAYEADE